MTSILQLDPPMPLTTPKGEAVAHLVIDYGIEHDLMWVCFLDADGSCWTFANPEVRALPNLTYGAPRQREYRCARCGVPMGGPAYLCLACVTPSGNAPRRCCPVCVIPVEPLHFSNGWCCPRCARHWRAGDPIDLSHVLAPPVSLGRARWCPWDKARLVDVSGTYWKCPTCHRRWNPTADHIGFENAHGPG